MVKSTAISLYLNERGALHDSRAAATASAEAETIWKITKDHWDASDEVEFGKFVAGFGEAKCTNPYSCFRSDANCERCPETTRLVEHVPGMQTAMFSILAPGKHIPPHDGPYKGVLRYHLGLLVPEPEDRVGIRVGGQPATWAEGESLVFDDTFVHEAWNDTDGTRVVLFVDFKRPLAGIPRLVNEAILKVIHDYTSEAGLRNLERELANVMRRTAKQIAEGKEPPRTIAPERVREMIQNIE